jgi:hypothetical protein
MNKYIVILSIIIVLYFVQKYCIKSEVETFLLTKNILEKFDQTTGGLNILGNIRLANRHIISSESEGLAIVDVVASTTANTEYGNIKVKDIRVTGTLIQEGGSNLPSSFTNSTQTARLNINSGTPPNSVEITSLNGPLILSGQNGPVTLASQNIIKIGGNIDITGNVTFNAAKPIVTRIITIPTNSTTPVTTGIDATDYPSITFSGFDNSTASSQSYAAAIEFNTTKGAGNKWFISFTPTPTPPLPINVRLTFFHKNLVQNDEGDSVAGVTVPGPPGTPLLSRSGDIITMSWVLPSNGGSPITIYKIEMEKTSSTSPVGPWALHATNPLGTSDTGYSYDSASNRVTWTRAWTTPQDGRYYRFKVAAFNNQGFGADSAPSTISLL